MSISSRPGIARRIVECVLPVEVGLRVAGVIVHGDALLDADEGDSVQVSCDE